MLTPLACLRYVALGDSYTIGTAVAERDRWPDQLVVALDRAGAKPTLGLVANLAVNGYTSRDVIEQELPQLGEQRPEFVTLLVGVNDVIQGVTPGVFRRQAAEILDDLLSRVGASRILVVTTPDDTVTPAGADFGDPIRRAEGIRVVNGMLTTIARSRNIAVVDIHDLSLRAATDRSLVAPDGLHPSGRQYGLWVDRIRPTVEAMLGR